MPPEPIFLLAPPRSCSTVSVAVLAQHPGIYGFPELVLFTADTVGEVLAGTGRRSALPKEWRNAQASGLLRTVAELHDQCQDDAAIERAQAWLRQRSHWSGAELMMYFLELVQPRIGLEKSPDTVTDEAAFARCVRAYPHARYLHLTRHPISTMTSMREHWRRLRPAPDEEALSRKCVAAWYRSHTNVMRLLDRLPRERWYRVRAEDLLGRPEVHLPRILDWLGLPWNESIARQMSQTQEWSFAGFGPSRVLGGGDWKFLRDPRLRALPAAGKVELDDSWTVTAEARRRCVELASYLGYE